LIRFLRRWIERNRALGLFEEPNFAVFPINIQGAGDTTIMMASLPVMYFIVSISIAVGESTK
jgi:hypothetical protein